MNKGDILKLADRVEGLSVPYNDELLDIAAAEALGWQLRRVTALGLNGRTPGRWLWFRPDYEFLEKGRRRPPLLSGPKRRKETAAALRAIAATMEDGHG